MDEQHSESPKPVRRLIRSEWIAFGVAIGTAIGVSTDHLAVWIALGAAVGLALGIVFGARKSR